MFSCISLYFCQVSLVNQDDALFRQLLALNTSIRQLRSQSLQRRARTLPGSHSSSSNGRATRNQLCPSPSTASLTSLTSMSSDDDDDVHEDHDEDEEEEDEPVAQSENKKSMLLPTAEGLPVLTANHHPAISGLQQQLQQHQKQQQQQQQSEQQQVQASLSRKRISYPPNGRNRSNASLSLSRCSFNSSSSTSSSSSSTGSPSCNWSAGIEAASVTIIKAASRTPRSPHSSFYTRVSVKTHQQQQQQQAKLLAAVDHHHQQQHRQSNDLQPTTLGVHKRQGSYDSGCQGSEPSDAEVFV